VVQAWLLHICRHKVIDHIRRKGRAQRPVALGVDAAPDPAHLAETTMRAHEMRHAMDELTEDQRDILVRRFVLDHSLEEVAAGTGRSVGAVKSLQHRALATLKRVLARRAA
jgi:RNA polymerase sigma-70 factor (ECF subfamily)